MPIAQVFNPRNRVPSNVIANGFNESVGDTFENIWPLGGRFDWENSWDLGPNSNVTIVSDSADDDAAGTGAQIVRVTGLGGDGLERNEFVPMDGLTPVVIPGTWLYIDSMQTLTGGSTPKENAGEVLVLYDNSIPVCVMPATTNLSQGLLATIQLLHSCFLYRFNV